MKGNIKLNLKKIFRWLRNKLLARNNTINASDIRNLILDIAKLHDKDDYFDDYNTICHLLMYLRQDGLEQNKYFALDIAADVIESLFIVDEVPPMVKFRDPLFFPVKDDMKVGNSNE